MTCCAPGIFCLPRHPTKCSQRPVIVRYAMTGGIAVLSAIVYLVLAALVLGATEG